jgi:hypothetical protein
MLVNYILVISMQAPAFNVTLQACSEDRSKARQSRRNLNDTRKRGLKTTFAIKFNLAAMCEASLSPQLEFIFPIAVYFPRGDKLNSLYKDPTFEDDPISQRT